MGIPVVAEQVGAALGAVELDPRAAVAPGHVRGQHRGERAAFVAQHELPGVGIAGVDLRPADRPAGDRRRRDGSDRGHRAEQRRQRLQVVDPDVAQRRGPVLVIPGRPRRPGVPVVGPRGVDGADRPVAHERPQPPERGTELHEGRGHQHQPAGLRLLEQGGGLAGARSRRLLHQHMAPGVQRGACEIGVCGRSGEDQHQVDAVGTEDLLRPLDQPDPRPLALERRPDLAPARADRALQSQAARREPVECLEIGRQHVPRSDHTDPHGTG